MIAEVERDNETTARLEGAVIDGRYRLLGVLGQGAMGIVYEAEHIRVGLRVAVKILCGDPAADPTLSERFRREARAASAAGHPNIVVVNDAGELPDGRPFIVMELLVGRVLSKVLAEDGPLSVGRACRIVRDIARGIEAAHRVGVIHRDLKPNNVYVLAASDAMAERVKVVDFGIAIASDAEVRMTQPGMIIGTPLYMAPEQCCADQPLPQSDLYALGVVLFELLAGQPPFRTAKAVQLLSMKTSRIAPRVAVFRPEVPDALDELVADCLEIDPARRPASATVVVERLEAILAALEPARLALPSPSPRPEPKRRGGFAMLFGMVAFSVLATWLAWSEPDPPLVIRDSVDDRAAMRSASAAAPAPAPAVTAAKPPTRAETTPTRIETTPTLAEPTPPMDVQAEPAPPKRSPPARATQPIATKPRVAAGDPGSAACIHNRRATQDCRESHDWQGVLRHTADADCWTSKRERTRMRTMALMELGRFEACLREAADSRDPALERTVTICRLRSQKPHGFTTSGERD